MDLTDREANLLQGLSGTAKSAASLIPGLAQAIAGWDAYHRSQLDRNIIKIVTHLQEKVDDLETFLNAQWITTDEGEQYILKVLDSALDTQIEDKQELFVNALIQGIRNPDIPHLEKLKFVDMLRHLSKASIMILAELHNMLGGQVRGPGRSPDSTAAFPLIDQEDLALKLSDRYDPYLVTSAVSELESEGLFSRTGEWKKNDKGKYMPGGGFSTEMCYTDFTARFVEFITVENKNMT
jgi:hypothetical protein